MAPVSLEIPLGFQILVLTMQLCQLLFYTKNASNLATEIWLKRMNRLTDIANNIPLHFR